MCGARQHNILCMKDLQTDASHRSQVDAHSVRTYVLVTSKHRSNLQRTKSIEIRVPPAVPFVTLVQDSGKIMLWG